MKSTVGTHGMNPRQQTDVVLATALNQFSLR